MRRPKLPARPSILDLIEYYTAICVAENLAAVICGVHISWGNVLFGDTLQVAELYLVQREGLF